MKFEWDSQKAAKNLESHGVPFDYAARVFLDLHRLETQDLREDYREERFITLGEIENRLYVVVYTVRNEVIRLISARKANQREQRKYGQIHS